jgi:C_GCAxxG_C_C family probable redox protein
VLAVGEHVLGKVDDQLQRATSGLSGGVGGTHEELCGALSGGVMIIGALHGRVLPDQDDSYCGELSARYRERFIQKFGTTRCADLRASGYGSDGEWPCSVLVERATQVLLEVLEDEEGLSR